MKKNYLKSLLLVGMVAVLNGCTLAPKYNHPTAPIPAVWPSGAAYRETRTATNAPGAPYIGWQDFFSDEKLQQVIMLPGPDEQSRSADCVPECETSLAIYGIQRAELLPSVNAGAGGSRQGVPADLSSSGQRMTAERYDLTMVWRRGI